MSQNVFNQQSNLQNKAHCKNHVGFKDIYMYTCVCMCTNMNRKYIERSNKKPLTLIALESEKESREVGRVSLILISLCSSF